MVKHPSLTYLPVFDKNTEEVNLRYYAGKPQLIDKLRGQAADKLLKQAQKIPFNYDDAKLACEQLGITIPAGNHRTIQEIFSRISRQANTHRDFLAAYINIRLCKK